MRVPAAGRAETVGAAITAEARTTRQAIAVAFDRELRRENVMAPVFLVRESRFVAREHGLAPRARSPRRGAFQTSIHPWVPDAPE
jgi:hypothetical protein